jgi:hypothetical protein
MQKRRTILVRTFRPKAAHDKSRQCCRETRMPTSGCQRFQRVTQTLLGYKVPYIVGKITRNDAERSARMSNGSGQPHRLDDRRSAWPPGTVKPWILAVFQAATSLSRLASKPARAAWVWMIRVTVPASIAMAPTRGRGYCGQPCRCRSPLVCGRVRPRPRPQGARCARGWRQVSGPTAGRTRRRCGACRSWFR